MAVATWRKIASRVSFLSRSVKVARGMPSAERKPSNVRVPKNASRMIKNAQASETISSVRATEQLRSRRAVGAAAASLCGAVDQSSTAGRAFVVATRAVAVLAIQLLSAVMWKTCGIAHLIRPHLTREKHGLVMHVMG